MIFSIKSDSIIHSVARIHDLLELFLRDKIIPKNVLMEHMLNNFLEQHLQVNFFSIFLLQFVSIYQLCKDIYIWIEFVLVVPRHGNKRSWLYRIRPSVCHLPFEPYTSNKNFPVDLNEQRSNPNQVNIGNDIHWKLILIPI